MICMTRKFPSKTEAEDAMRRMSLPDMKVVYSKRQRGWVISYTIE
jgi:hypothetical protein